jgi:hypothetical protein
VGFVHPIRCLAILVLGIFLGGLPPAAQEVLPDGKHSVVPTHQKPEDWTLNPNWDSIPMLSQKGKSAGQFQLIVREIERYLGKPLDTEKVAIAAAKADYLNEYVWYLNRQKLGQRAELWLQENKKKADAFVDWEAATGNWHPRLLYPDRMIKKAIRFPLKPCILPGSPTF